jgi:hypothetical protein
MEAHSLSSQYELGAHNGRDANISNGARAPYGGDFAAGLRGSRSEASVRGDFAAGMRSTPLPMTAGDFATGLRTHPAAQLVRGNFATGQRAEWSDPRRHRHPAHHPLPPRQRSGVTVAEPARP